MQKKMVLKKSNQRSTPTFNNSRGEEEDIGIKVIDLLFSLIFFVWKKN